MMRLNSESGDTLPAGARWAKLARQASVCGRQMRRSLAEHAAVHHLNDAEFLLLWAFHEVSDEGLAQNDLAAAVGLSTSQISGLVERLRQRGLATVERSRLDRRRQHWCLTESGSQVLHDVLGRLAPFAESLDRNLTPSDRIQADEILHRLAEIASSSDDDRATNSVTPRRAA